METHVSFVPPELSRWDTISAEALAVPLFEDQRPLRGAAGLADWRLCGRLSRWILAGRIGGGRGETMLFPPGRRLTFARLLVYGGGKERDLGEPGYRELVRELRRALARLALRRVAVALPGRDSGKIAPRRALEIFLEESADGSLADVVLIENAASQKEMADVLRASRPGSRVPAHK